VRDLGKIKHGVLIVLENTDWSKVKGSPSAPYINRTLLPKYAHSERYYSVGHPSLPNYISVEAGADLGLIDGHYLPSDHSVRTHDHLTVYLQGAGYSWKYYGETLPGGGSRCNLTNPAPPYSEDHNPFVYFQDVSSTQAPSGFGAPSADSSYCRRHERPYKELMGDLATNHAPNYSSIVPNDYDNGDREAPGSHCALCQADSFLSHVVPTIQRSRAYGSGVIFIVWDEGSPGADNPIGLIAVSRFAKRGTQAR